MNTRKMVIRVVLVVIGLPVKSVLIFGVSFYFLDRTNGTIVSSGEERRYLLYVPRSYDRAKPTPLVISMHAAAFWPAAQMETSQWNKVADEHGFIVVYPSGTGLIPFVIKSPIIPTKIWRVESEKGLLVDVRFISELIDRLEAAYNIDPTRIYANGFSNGGGMAFVLSSVAADVNRLEYANCADDAAVLLYTVQGGGHSWPGGKPMPEWMVGPTSRSIDASSQMWALFRERRLPGK